MPSVWTRSAGELHREYIANTEAFYRAAGRSLAGELDGFMRAAALGLWKNSGAVNGERGSPRTTRSTPRAPGRPRPCSGI